MTARPRLSSSCQEMSNRCSGAEAEGWLTTVRERAGLRPARSERAGLMLALQGSGRPPGWGPAPEPHPPLTPKASPSTLLAPWRLLGRRALAGAMLAVALIAGTVAAGAAPALAAGPVVHSFSPSSGTIGTKVTITGSGFTGAAAVVFGNPGAATLATVKSDTTITATVPASASTGKISVIAPGGTPSSTATFTVNPGIVLSAATGHPAGTVSVSGAGFRAFEAVDIYFDTADEALATTTGTGTFAGITIAVPPWAVPGSHWITAVGRRSGSAVQTAYTVNTNWAEFHYSGRLTGANPYENVLSPFNVTGIDEDWHFTTGDLVNSSPAVVNGVAYVGSDDDKVYALKAATGAKLWSFTTGSDVVNSPTVANGVVYIGSDDSKMYALNAATGAMLWSFKALENPSTAAVAGGVVYFDDGIQNVYALNAATGAKLWTAFIDASSTEPAVAN